MINRSFKTTIFNHAPNQKLLLLRILNSIIKKKNLKLNYIFKFFKERIKIILFR